MKRIRVNRVLLLSFVLIVIIMTLGVMIYRKAGTTLNNSNGKLDSTVYHSVSSKVTIGVEAVDLGLPSGTKWANMNVGAFLTEDYGDYYAWGETITKEEYSWNTYMVKSSFDCGTSSDPIYVAGLTDIAGTQFDVATAKWGGSWKMPTFTQIEELLYNCTWTWTTQNGINGYEVTGSNGKSIFLPAAGYRYDSSLNDEGFGGNYWSATRNRYAADYDYSFFCARHEPCQFYIHSELRSHASTQAL